jgi:hypothetical protein
VEKNLRSGMDPGAARRAAAPRFGSLDSEKESVGGRWTLLFFERRAEELAI